MLSRVSAEPDPVDAGTDAAGAADAQEEEEHAVADASDDAGALVVNGRFESGCAGWMTYHSMLKAAPDAGLTGGACEACVVGAPGDGYSLAQDIDVVPVVGARYVGQMWLHDAPGATSNRAYVVVRTFDADGGEVEAAGSQPITLTTDYQSTGVTLLVTKAAARLEIYAFSKAPTAPSDCFFADDATLNAE